MRQIYFTFMYGSKHILAGLKISQKVKKMGLKSVLTTCTKCEVSHNKGRLPNESLRYSSISILASHLQGYFLRLCLNCIFLGQS